jgi:hypothetical protein
MLSYNRDLGSWWGRLKPEVDVILIFHLRDLAKEGEKHDISDGLAPLSQCLRLFVQRITKKISFKERRKPCRPVIA